MNRVGNSQNYNRRRRQFPLERVKLLIVAVGAAFISAAACLSGITPQAGMAPMLSWMLGFTAEKAQATAMRITATAAVSCLVGAIWRLSVLHNEPAGAANLHTLNQLHLFGAPIAILSFVAVTIGALLSIKLTPGKDKPVQRRIFLFAGVCIGIFAASAATHVGGVGTTVKILELNSLPQAVLVGLIAGVLTQVLGLTSGIVLVPAIYFFTTGSEVDAVLISLSVIALATVLPLISYTSRGLVSSAYATAGMSSAIPVGAACGWFLITAPERLLLMIFALMSMFYSAREISKIVMEAPVVPPGPDLK